MSPLAFRIAAAWVISVAAMFPVVAQEPQSVEAPEIVVTGKASDKDVVTRVVKIGDLNLATDDGVAEMKKRVASAVDDICTIPAVVGYYRDKAEKPCREEGWASATPQMDSAQKKAREGSGG
jgi:UrcA family protein